MQPFVHTNRLAKEDFIQTFNENQEETPMTVVKTGNKPETQTGEKSADRVKAVGVYVNICILSQPLFLLSIKRKCGRMTVSQGQSFSLSASETDVALRGFGNCRNGRRVRNGGGVSKRHAVGKLLL